MTMTSPTDLSQLYILLSYEKLQRSTISQHQRPIEASLRNRLLVWRFLKKIENEPVSTPSNSEQQLLTNNVPNNSSWILNLNENCDDDQEIDMDIDSDIVTVVSNNETNNNSTCDTMDIEQETDVTLLLKRAIGAERRQKPSTENMIVNENNNNNNNLSENTTLEETEQFFHDLCAELTTTTAALVSSSSTNSLRCPTPPEQTLIH